MITGQVTRRIGCTLLAGMAMLTSHNGNIAMGGDAPRTSGVAALQASDAVEQDRCLCSLIAGERDRLLSHVNRERTVAPQTALASSPLLNSCLIGTWDQYAGFYSDIWADGNYVYMGNYGLSDGFPARVMVIDITNPSNPVLDEELFLPPPNNNASPQDVKVGDGLLFVALEGDLNDSVAIYDVRNPANRPLIATINVSGFQAIHNVFYEGGYLYMVTSSGPPAIAIVDLTTFDPDNPPASPITTAKWVVSNVGTVFVHDITVKGGRLYAAAWDSGLWVYDVTNIATSAPAFLGSVGGDNTHSMWPTDDGNYVVTGEERGGGGIQVFRITDNGGSLSFTFTDGLVLPNTFSVHNQIIIGHRLYNSWYAQGFQAFDIDPISGLLTFVASYDTSDSGLGNWGVYPFLGDDKILLSDVTDGLFVIDLSVEPCVCNPSSPPELQTQFTPTLAPGDPEPKNRALAVKAGDVGLQQTIRVTWDAQPSWSGGHAALVGQQKWMTEPFQVCENSGNGFGTEPPNCGPSPGQPQNWFWAARLACDPTSAHYSNLATLADYCTGSGEGCTTDGDCAQGTCGVDGVIHIIDQGIVPSKNVNQQAIYSMQVIESACAQDQEANFSDALAVTQPLWGDMGNGTDCPMAPPNGAADLVPDVTAALQKFSNALCAPKKTRADVGPDSLDMNVGIADVLQLLNAFSSGSSVFPFAAGPACPTAG